LKGLVQMLVSYSYLCYDYVDGDYRITEHGKFQCDVEDFRKFFRTVVKKPFEKPMIRCIIAELQDGRLYVWQRPPYYIHGRINKDGKFGGWSQVR